MEEVLDWRMMGKRKRICEGRGSWKSEEIRYLFSEKGKKLERKKMFIGKV
jgi:hypothetical protein